MTLKAHSVSIAVKTEYLPQHPKTKDNKFAFAYHISITNNHDETLQLMRRHWLITDGNGKKVEVDGEGVVGDQPRIESGQSYQYSSGALLDTPVGTMEGHYDMENQQGQVIKAFVSRFTLAKPNSIN